VKRLESKEEVKMENANFNTGGTGAALFAGKSADAANGQTIGDEYKAPAGLPEWKQPSFDDDDRVDGAQQPFKPTGFWGAIQVVKNEMHVAKAFYFLFFGAFGSLFPLLAVYFKGLGMDAAQCGFLIGVRPIVEYLATPFWHGISDRFQAGKVLMLLAITSWVAFTLPIGYIHPPVVSCKAWNGSRYLLQEPKYTREHENLERKKRSLPVDIMPLFPLGDLDIDGDQSNHKRVKRDEYSDHKWAPGYTVGTSPSVMVFDDMEMNYDKRTEWVSPSFSNEVFERSGVEKVFFLVLLLVMIGEFFASPAIALADSAVIQSLGEKQDKYGAQRMFGSIGWGVCMFVMGIVLDYSTLFPTAKCDLNAGERNYNVCFYMFSFMMVCALLVATQIQFRYLSPKQNDVPLDTRTAPGGPQGKGMGQKTKQQLLKEESEKMKVFAQQLRSKPQFIAVFKAFSNFRLLAFMIVAWIMGVGIGLIFTFLFWHLQDYGGHPTIFGIASVINHVSEMGAYFYSFKFITKYGHVKVLIAGLLGNLIRFLYISFITWPWLVLPFEFLQGITHAAVWAACCSFISHNTDAELRPSAQGVLQGVHHGFGRFCGAVFGGMLIKTHGTKMIFRIYGAVCGVVALIFTAINFYSLKEGKFTSDLGEEIDPRNVMESEPLGPHGVPSSAFKHKLGASRRSSYDQAAMAATEEEPTKEPAATSTNPFLTDAVYDSTGAAQSGEDGQYYGRGYTQAQSGYSASGLGY